MTRTSRAAAFLAAATMALTVGTGIANAETIEHTYPETPKLNPKLPIVHTYHGSDHLRANVLNPEPVCNSGEDFRTTVYKVTDNFTPAGTISTTNTSNGTIPLTQDLNRTQSVSLSVNGGYAQTTSANLGVKDDNSEAGISHEIASNIGADFAYELSWTAGQTIGPYDVPAGHTGEATYGFRVLHMSGVQQFCKANGTWSTPTAWSALAPMKNEVQVSIYDDPADAPRDKGGPEHPEFNKVEPVRGTEAPDFSDVEANEALDLEPRLTTAAGKSEGFAGVVALRVKNVGTERYDVSQNPVRFRVEVGTVEGPEGVDRLNTAGRFNGAHVQDLGFDKASSTRVFEVTLSNPIDPGQEVLLGNLNFGDGNTSRGRIINDITVTQIGRAAGDTSTDNDWNVNSADITYTDGGKKHSGRF
ncbi:hypothetical protein C3B44_11310 [Corynebacterium yudongzhengii]|uniref:Secreted protein n=1 Tax=Corynebacterium yudongzhengii TaxID=2080740 RepID=A0A2U1T430_9CORY|nr:hypothetical protein [Corynebacterium yudongzhengii]AWB82843.1 hypothetical protein C3B44_11310 [Corynebacterium yudongzhengii]PWC00754.1 hypothetical protein DF222_11115 [Corynebacterium yudongzhengii]